MPPDRSEVDPGRWPQQPASGDAPAFLNAAAASPRRPVLLSVAALVLGVLAMAQAALVGASIAVTLLLVGATVFCAVEAMVLLRRDHAMLALRRAVVRPLALTGLGLAAAAMVWTLAAVSTTATITGTGAGAGAGAVGSAPGAGSPVPSARSAQAHGASLSLGQATKVGDWTVSVASAQLNADEAVAQANPSYPNAAPKGQYLAADITMRYGGAGRGNPTEALRLSFVGPDGARAYETTVQGLPNRFALDTVRAGTTVKFTMVFDVPVGTTSGQVDIAARTADPNTPHFLWSLAGAGPTRAPSPAG